MKNITVIFAALLGFCLASGRSGAAVALVELPTEIVGGITLGFDEFTANTALGNRYPQFGLRFSRDDGQAVVAYDYVAIGRTTPSPRNVLSTAYVPGVNTTYATHLNAISTAPLYAVGAYFGGDRGDSDFAAIRLSVFGVTGDLLGSVTVSGNGDKSADQYIGIGSDVPFTQIRFDNLNVNGEQSRSFAVAVDNFKFSQLSMQVPEPSTFSLLGLGLAGAAAVWRKRRTYLAGG